MLQPGTQHRKRVRAPHHRLLDPFLRKEGLEEKPLGQAAHLAAKAKGDNSMPSEAEEEPKTCRAWFRETRVIWRSPYWLNLSLQRCKCLSPDTTSTKRGRRNRTVLNMPTELFFLRAVVSEATQGDARGAYVTLDTSSSKGMRDRLRGASPTATEPP